MAETSISLLIAGMALINLLIRYPLYLFADRFRFPSLIERALNFVPAAVLTAIIVPTVVYPTGTKAQLDWHNPFLIAAILTAIVSYVTRNLLATIVIGMTTFLVLRWWFSG